AMVIGVVRLWIGCHLHPQKIEFSKRSEGSFQCWMFSVSPGVEVTNRNAFPGKALRPKFGYFQKLNTPGVLSRKSRIGRGHWSDEKIATQNIWVIQFLKVPNLWSQGLS